MTAQTWTKQGGYQQIWQIAWRNTHKVSVLQEEQATEESWWEWWLSPAKVILISCSVPVGPEDIHTYHVIWTGYIEEYMYICCEKGRPQIWKRLRMDGKTLRVARESGNFVIKLCSQKWIWKEKILKQECLVFVGTWCPALLSSTNRKNFSGILPISRAQYIVTKAIL